MPQVVREPALMTWKVSPPSTATGVGLSVLEPLPSWPEKLDPQQDAVPEVVMRHVYPYPLPALTDLKVKPPGTGRGTVLQGSMPAQASASGPIPRRSAKLLPQQYPAPPVVTPHVWPVPVL